VSSRPVRIALMTSCCSRQVRGRSPAGCGAGREPVRPGNGLSCGRRPRRSRPHARCDVGLRGRPEPAHRQGVPHRLDGRGAGRLPFLRSHARRCLRHEALETLRFGVEGVLSSSSSSRSSTISRTTISRGRTCTRTSACATSSRCRVGASRSLRPRASARRGLARLHRARARERGPRASPRSRRHGPRSDPPQRLRVRRRLLPRRARGRHQSHCRARLRGAGGTRPRAHGPIWAGRVTVRPFRLAGAEGWFKDLEQVPMS